jgi:hypothetical protein
MSIQSIAGSPVQGIQRGLQGLRRVATQVANSQHTQEMNGTDFSRAMVEIQQQANQTKVSAKALQHINRTLGTLFDDRA